MARIRSICPEACDSEKLAQLSDQAERLFWRLQTHCDDEGRCVDDPRIIRARCATLLDWTTDHVDGLLDEMQAVRLIVRYVVDGNPYIEVAQWDRFQHPQRPTKGERPGPDGVYSAVVKRGKPERESRPRQGELTGDTRRGHDTDVSTLSVSAVPAGGDWSGEDGRPPNGGGGSREEGGETAPRGGRPRPFTGEPATNEHVSRLQQRIASSPLNAQLGAN